MASCSAFGVYHSWSPYICSNYSNSPLMYNLFPLSSYFNLGLNYIRNWGTQGDAEIVNGNGLSMVDDILTFDGVGVIETTFNPALMDRFFIEEIIDNEKYVHYYSDNKLITISSSGTSEVSYTPVDEVYSLGRGVFPKDSSDSALPYTQTMFRVRTDVPHELRRAWSDEHGFTWVDENGVAWFTIVHESVFLVEHRDAWVDENGDIWVDENGVAWYTVVDNSTANLRDRNVLVDESGNTWYNEFGEVWTN